MNFPTRLRAQVLKAEVVRMHPKTYSRFLNPFWLFYLNLDDGMHIKPDKKNSLTLTRNKLYILPPHLHWQITVKKELNHFYMVVDCPGFPHSLVHQHYNQIVSFPTLPKWKHMESDTLSFLKNNSSANTLHPSFEIHALANTLLAFLTRQITTIKTPPPALEKTIDYIEQNITKDCRINTLAAISGIPSRRFTDLFKQSLGTTPSAYVQSRKLAQASHLLSTTTETLEKIAEKCGFPNRHYMTRIFTSKIKLSPAAYRKRYHTPDS